ncbi:hypothetical protein ACQCSX_09505 [Pseudarthrobacter sp. P1]|uniref:hypothetical protein n=1 Tax=Pseudarthrobacter sp. P1 TaxID=3418418 RepID=UPI003CECC402
MDWLWTILTIAGLVALATGGIVLMQRGLDKPGARDSMGTLAGAITGIEGLVNPGAANARAEIEEQTRQRAPIPSAGDGLRGVKITLDDDGVPTKIVIPPPPPN